MVEIGRAFSSREGGSVVGFGTSGLMVKAKAVASAQACLSLGSGYIRNIFL
jgi:hypothetical protein